jgi:hypothetical protein
MMSFIVHFYCIVLDKEMPGPFVVSKSSKPADLFRHDGCVFIVFFLFGPILIHSALLRSVDGVFD